MSDALATYLHDHLAASHFAIKLLGSLEEQYKGDKLGEFARWLAAQLKQDQEALRQVIQKVGETQLDLTEATGWLAEKASQFKLERDDPGGGLGTFEAIETLTLGIRGKLAVWHALPLIREIDRRVPPIDFGRLAVRADEQYAAVEQQRLQLIRDTFGPQRSK
jgi:hypothetical protein